MQNVLPHNHGFQLFTPIIALVQDLITSVWFGLGVSQVWFLRSAPFDKSWEPEKRLSSSLTFIIQWSERGRITIIDTPVQKLRMEP